MHARLWVADDVRLGSSSGGSSPAASPSGPSDSDGGSTSTDEHCPDDPRESRRHFSRFRPTSPSSSSPLCGDDYKHLQRMALLLPAFSSTAAARADALRQWIAGFDVGWVLDMGRGSGADHGLPRREVGRRIRAWAQALGAMDRVFRGRHNLEARSPASDAAAAELAGESVGVMLRLTGTVAALASSPSKLLAALDAAIVRCAVRADVIGMRLPPGWVRAREERMEGYIRDYLRVSWAPVVSRLDGKPGAMNALRRRNLPSAFHSAFQNACGMQRGWKVPSPVLRGDLRMAVSETVVPAVSGRPPGG
ncbi:hypothetical protein VPH35_139671 [Triticum aestivum]